MSQVSPSSLLRVGRVLRPHGVGGLIRICSYAGSEVSFLKQGTVFLKSCSDQILEYRVISIKPHKKVFLMELEGLNSRDQAEEFRNAEIFVRKDSLSREEGEFFWHELLGLRVYLEDGKYLGSVSGIISTGSNDIYVVREGDKEYLIPATYEVVKEIDVDNGKMTVAVMEGLLDLNEV